MSLVQLSTGAAYRAVHRAICDPAVYCNRIQQSNSRSPSETIENWQTRAVLAALDQEARA